MNKKTITAGISALAISGVLFGTGLTSTAHAATPTTPTEASEVTAQASQNFDVTNWLGLGDASTPERLRATLELAGVYGQTDSHPLIGSTLTYGQSHNFAVQTALLQDRDVFVTYRVHVDGKGYVGDIQLQLSVSWNAEVTSRLSVNNTPYKMHLDGGAAWPIIVF